MNWPDKPICHEYDPLTHPVQSYGWRMDGAFRLCAYCGSLHPEDLSDVLFDPDVTLGGADWKYSWPHKFYLRGEGVDMFKWYNIHFLDLDDDAFSYLAAIVSEKSGIEWFRDGEGQVQYRAPYYGYQQFELSEFDQLFDDEDDD